MATLVSNTRIPYLEAVWNPWIGCTEVSAGCANCYFHRGQGRFRDTHTLARTSADTWKQLLAWNKAARIAGGPAPMVGVCFLSDFFHPAADEWRPEAWDIMRGCTHLALFITTKRTERIAECLPPDWGQGWPHVWVGASVESGAYSSRLWDLQEVPAAHRWLSYEPAIGPLAPFPEPNGLDWVVSGGETGPNARPTHPLWHQAVATWCHARGIPYDFKQLGEWQPVSDIRRQMKQHKGKLAVVCVYGQVREPLGQRLVAGEVLMGRIGAKATGCELGGKEYHGRPETLQWYEVREYCPHLTCLEPTPHWHPICPKCGAAQFGNAFCVTCIEHFHLPNVWPITLEYDRGVPVALLRKGGN